MTRYVLAAGAAALMGSALMWAVTPAFAESDQAACESDGGIYEKVQGTSFCSYPVGNSGKFKVVEMKGSFAADGGHDEEYTNPGGKKPPGKQGGDTLR